MGHASQEAFDEAEPDSQGCPRHLVDSAEALGVLTDLLSDPLSLSHLCSPRYCHRSNLMLTTGRPTSQSSLLTWVVSAFVTSIPNRSGQQPGLGLRHLISVDLRQEGLLDTTPTLGQVTAWRGDGAGAGAAYALDWFPEENAQLSPEGYRGGTIVKKRVACSWATNNCRNPHFTWSAWRRGNGCLLSGTSIMMDLRSFILSVSHLTLLP